MALSLAAALLPDTIAMLPFEFVIYRSPVSQQARRRELVRQWTQEVHNAAAALWSGQPAVDGALAVSITHLFDRAELDVDNMPKPILDALKGLIYSDDAAVTDLNCRKRNLKDDPQISNASPVLRQSLNRNVEFVHVFIADAPIREVNF